MPVNGREVRLAARPRAGRLQEEDFEVAEVELAAPGEGEVLIRNEMMSVDPYMRARLAGENPFSPPFRVGSALTGGAVGRVVASGDSRLQPGDLVQHDRGWRDYALIASRYARPIDDRLAPASAYLGVLGIPGLTAYAGLELAELRPGDRVFVSSAAGAVGSIAAQLAKLRSHFVVGSTGSAAKAAHLVERLGLDAAINYRDGEIVANLRDAAPEGIDVYFDNVGGEQLDAAISCMRNWGRVMICGAVSGYGGEAQHGLRNLLEIPSKRITLRGFAVYDHIREMREAFLAEVGGAFRDGRLVADETIVDGGLEKAASSLVDLLDGQHVGKMLVRLA